MRTKAIHLSALAAVLVSGAALAQGSPTSPTSPSSPPTSSGSGAGAEYSKLDKDKDGTVSKKEAASNKDLTKQWDTLDVNKDGKLDEAEFAQFQASPTGADSGSMKKDEIKY
jgi:hypothetical protein